MPPGAVCICVCTTNFINETHTSITRPGMTQAQTPGAGGKLKVRVFNLDLNKLEEAVNRRLKRGRVHILMLSQFDRDLDDELVATGYAALQTPNSRESKFYQFATRPLEVKILTELKKVRVRAGVVVVDVPLSEVEAE